MAGGGTAGKVWLRSGRCRCGDDVCARADDSVACQADGEARPRDARLSRACGPCRGRRSACVVGLDRTDARGARRDVTDSGVTVQVRNLGTGLAVLAAPATLIQVERVGSGWIEGKTPKTVVSPEDDVFLEFDVPHPRLRAVVQVAYTDVVGDQLRRTRLLVLPAERGGWFVEGFALYNGSGPVEPSVMTGPWLPEERGPA